MELLGAIWNEAIIRPMINSLVLLYAVFFSNFGLAIIAFTIVVRAAMVPLTVKQARQMKALQTLQPKLQDIQKKYKGDRQRISQETMGLYKTEGVNPLGCLGPLVVQMPIFLGLFWALRGTLPSTPERLADLGGQLYSWMPFVHQAVPLDGSFLWMNLADYASTDTVPLLLPVLVGGSMFLMQKMTPTSNASPQQVQTQRLMLWMMPLMFGVFTLSFEMGLAVYWIMSNVVGIVIQGFVTGWDPLFKLLDNVRPGRSAAKPPATPDEEADTDGTDTGDDGPAEDGDGDDGKDGRRGDRARSKGARRRTRGSRNRRRQQG